jgi:transcriptional regulator with PAS, ATPase and Fis domain
MLLGETGTGKEMLARFIHENSDRAAAPFVPVDCSSLSDTLFESELFGHVKGSFTGATRDSIGFVRAAHGGTLFLDEIGELGLPLQAKLLRVIQERKVVAVGDVRPRAVDVRIIAATHRDLGEMVRRGTFREDLMFRLNVVSLRIPPLRERRDDVPLLAHHFLAAQSELYDEPGKTLSCEAGDLLLRYDWPGNVRELSNVIEHAYVLCAGRVIGPDSLPQRVRAATAEGRRPGHAAAEGGGGGGADSLMLVDVERRAIIEALKLTKFNKAAACRILGINVQRLNRRISRLGLRIPS